MKSIYHIPIEKLRQEGLKELFDALERAFKKYQVDFVRAAMSLLELILTGILDIVEFQKE